jgi:hypothetical protein
MMVLMSGHRWGITHLQPKTATGQVPIEGREVYDGKQKLVVSMLRGKNSRRSETQSDIRRDTTYHARVFTDDLPGEFIINVGSTRSHPKC